MLYKVNEEVKISWEKINENIKIKFMKKVGGLKLILHWGIFKKYPITEWNRPKISCLPLKTYKYKYDSAALETEFITDKDMETIEMNLNKNEGMGLSFVFYRPFGDVWYNNEEKDFQIFFNGQENIKYNMCITLSKFGKNRISYNSDNNENDEKMKKEILEHIKLSRSISIKSLNNNKKILENICIYGNIMRNQIKNEIKLYPKRFINVDNALNLEKTDKELFVLGLLGNNLEKNGTEVVIEKEKKENENDEEKNENLTSLEIIVSGKMQKKKYELHFDFGETKNEEYLNDKKEFEDLKERIKRKISKDYNIPKDEIIVTYPQKGSLKVQIIFEKDEFNNLNITDFEEKFKGDRDFQELNNLKEIHTDVIFSICKLNKNLLDSRGNRCDNWGINEKRGNMPYDPPIGWIGIGLNVWDQYDNGNNTWIGMINCPREWCVAYHGVGNNQVSNQVKDIIGKIISDNFKSGTGQLHKCCNDKYHPGKKVGTGVYCTPNIKTAEDYSGVSEINGQTYKTVLMVRVRPDAIRCCGEPGHAKDYWVTNGTNDEIRPYRILYKKYEKL